MKKSGFTLVELLAILTILAILGAIIMWPFTPASEAEVMRQKTADVSVQGAFDLAAGVAYLELPLEGLSLIESRMGLAEILRQWRDHYPNRTILAMSEFQGGLLLVYDEPGQPAEAMSVEKSIPVSPAQRR